MNIHKELAECPHEWSKIRIEREPYRDYKAFEGLSASSWTNGGEIKQHDLSKDSFVTRHRDVWHRDCQLCGLVQSTREFTETKFPKFKT